MNRVLGIQWNIEDDKAIKCKGFDVIQVLFKPSSIFQLHQKVPKVANTCSYSKEGGIC